jgi:hypothetical protein
MYAFMHFIHVCAIRGGVAAQTLFANQSARSFASSMNGSIVHNQALPGKPPADSILATAR